MEAPTAFVDIATVALAVIATMITGIVACITYLQFRIQRDNLKLALFERRAAIYTSAKQLIVDAMTTGKSEKEKLLSFYWKIGESKFLFNEEISGLMEEILNKTTELQHTESMAKSTERDAEQQARFWKRHKDARDWLIAQQPTLLEKFKPFLSYWSA